MNKKRKSDWAIIDRNGIIERGPLEDILPLWEDEEEIDEINRDKERKGDLMLVSIQEVKH